MTRNVIFALALTLLISCGNENPDSNVANDLDSLSASLNESNKKHEKTRYKLPSPVELYLHIKKANAPSVSSKLHNPIHAGNYLTEVNKSVNLGIYASDLAYCTVYEHIQESHEYFRILKILANQLGITEGYDLSILERIDQNLNNSDSLYQISSDSYWEVCSYLENNDKANTLALILLGGWVESVYIAINSVEAFDSENEIVLRITEQSYLLENLLDYLNTLTNNKQTSDYVLKLTDLQYSFDKLFDNPDDVLITKSQYIEIAEKINSLRNQLTSWQ